MYLYLFLCTFLKNYPYFIIYLIRVKNNQNKEIVFVSYCQVYISFFLIFPISVFPRFCVSPRADNDFPYYVDPDFTHVARLRSVGNKRAWSFPAPEGKQETPLIILIRHSEIKVLSHMCSEKLLFISYVQ